MNATSTVYYNDVAYQLVVQYTAADAANAANLIIDGQAIPTQPGQPYLGTSQRHEVMQKGAWENPESDRSAAPAAQTAGRRFNPGAVGRTSPGTGGIRPPAAVPDCKADAAA